VRVFFSFFFDLMKKPSKKFINISRAVYIRNK